MHPRSISQPFRNQVSYPFFNITSAVGDNPLLELRTFLSRITNKYRRNVIGVVKAYVSLGSIVMMRLMRSIQVRMLTILFSQTTRVGGGPFPTEQHDDVGTKLQEIGGEIVSHHNPRSKS